jgi:RodZ C-terminal domain
MSNRTHDEQRFDEHAALEELERVRNQIVRYQAERKALEEEFERFTASFKQPPSPQRTPAVVPPQRTPSVPPPIVPATASESDPVVERPLPRRDEEPAPAPLAVEPPPPAVEPPPLVVEPPPLAFEPPPLVPELPQVSRSVHRLSLPTPLMIAGAVLLVAGTLVIWRQARPAVRPAGPASASVRTRAPETPPAKPTTVNRAAQAAAQGAREESVVTTTRAVWVRVVADGVPVVERELPANARLPFVARDKIVIRTGNAGAVRLTIGGIDQGALGGFGEVVTRSFDVPR